MMILPMVIPHFLMGVALLLFFAFLRLPLSRLTVVLGHIVFTVPFAILIVSARLYGFDRSLERAAGDLGATPARVFWHVTLPLILPGVAGAALFVFTLSMDEFLITFFVSGQKGTLTMYIWSLLKDGIAPRVNALASVLLAASFALLLVGGWLLDRGAAGRSPRGGHREAADRGKDARGRDGIARAVHGRRSRLARGPDLQPGLRGGRGAPAAPARGVRALHGHQRARGGAHVQEPRRARRRMSWA